ncbi:MAG: hypothetical protein WBC71_03805 [Salaquimonas sp.]
MGWLAKNGLAIQSIAAIFTAIVALGALIGVKIQLDAADRLQNLQSAREAYRSHLTLAIANPDLAAPDDVCVLLSSPKAVAYTAFVDHLLYSAEQMLEVEDGWESTFKEELEPHSQFLCPEQGAVGRTWEVNKLVSDIIKEQCTIVSACQ